MTTYRERREARAERLRGWADKRETKATEASDRAHQMADAIPFGQPILVGHYSEGRDRNYRARISTTMDRAVEHARKARSMNERANNIEHALDASIYDDDPDACERLTVKLARLEAKRASYKAHNAAAKAAGEPILPSYALSNLGATIRTTRQRLNRLQATP